MNTGQPSKFVIWQITLKDPHLRIRFPHFLQQWENIYNYSRTSFRTVKLEEQEEKHIFDWKANPGSCVLGLEPNPNLEDK